MSFLFCSWATEGAEEIAEDNEHSVVEEVKNKNDFRKSGLNNHKISEDLLELKKEESKEVIPLNGDCHSNENVQQKPSMFVLWKDPGLDYKSEEEEAVESTGAEIEKEEKEAVTEAITSNGNGEVEKVEEEKEDNSQGKKGPLFFAVWKDPNKEEEYVSDSSSEYLSEDEEEENAPTPSTACNIEEAKKSEENGTEGLQSKNKSDEVFNTLMGETNGSEDLFNSIAKSVTTQMTTIFCDDEDFDIKRYDDSDNDNTDFNVENHLDSVLASNGKRSRSASSHSLARSVQSNSSERSHSFSLRPKREKSYDIFSKPKKISKYFEPGNFIDKTLYKTHRCDVKIKKFKLQIQDWEDLAPVRRKRKVVEAEEDLPLSKRKKMRSEVKISKARSVSSITKREESCGAGDGKYHGVCKFVKAQCPLCWNFWQVSQPYGQHVIQQTCQQSDSAVSPQKAEEAAKFITVHPSSTETDSYVSTSSVPSLKLLSRGGLLAGNSTSQVPISVKEGLEYYHSLVLPGNADETNLFSYISSLGKITLVSSVKQFERLCRDPLKVAIYLEKKISRCRAKLHPGHLLTRNWVEKYKFFLTLPLHDIFLSVVPQGGWRVLEVPDMQTVRLLCLVCSSLSCSGCSAGETLSQDQNKKNRAEPARKQRRKVKTKVKTKGKNKKNKVKESKSKTLKSPGIKLQLHLCKKCKKYFKNVAALKSHTKFCR